MNRGIRNIILSFLILFSWIGTQRLISQDASMSLGNTFIHSEGSMTVFDFHAFETSVIGSLPGIIGSERMPARGYFNFGQGSGWIGAESGHYVDGYVRYFGDSPFLFPIGDNGKYRPAAISEGSYVEAAYYGVNPAIAITSDLKGGNYPVLPESGPFNPAFLDASLIKVGQYEYWDINGPDPAIITLTWDEDSEVEVITSGILEELTIAGWDGNQWVKIPSEINNNSILLSDYSVNFSGPASDLQKGSISTSIPIVPSDFEVYTLAASCNDIYVEITSDTIICLGEQIILTAHSPSHPTAQISWDNGETGNQIIVTPDQTSYYVATAILGDCSSANNVLVEVSQPMVDLGPDFFICRGDEVTLTAISPDNVQYTWSNGTFGGDQITVSPLTSDTFYVTVTDTLGCQAVDGVFIEVRDKPDVFTGRERSLCLGDSVFIQAFGSATGYGYLWSTGDTSDIITVSPTVDTEYEVYLSNNGCTDTSYVSVLILDPVPVTIVGDSVICPGDLATLSAVGNGVGFLWSTGSQDSTITVSPLQNETYYVTITSLELCESVDSIEVQVYDDDLVTINDSINVCPGDTALFTATGVYDSIIWPDGSMGATFASLPVNDTTFSAVSYFNQCTTVHELSIHVDEKIYVDLGPDINICPGDTFDINLDTIPGTFLWSTGDTTSNVALSPSVTSQYSVFINSGTCYAEDSIVINVNPFICNPDIFVEKSVDNQFPDVGDILNFNIEAGNNSDLTIQNIIITEELQNGFTYISHSTTRGIYNTQTNEWILDELGPMESAFLNIQVSVNSFGPHINTASVKDPDPEDTETSNNSSTVEVYPQFTGEIGDRVWHDADGDGVQDNTELGMANINITLYQLADPHTPIDSQITDAQGKFCFTGLPDGQYFLKMTFPDTYMITQSSASTNNPDVSEDVDSDYDESNGPGTSDTITITNSSKIKSIDGGLHKYSAIGDLVWLDKTYGISNVYMENIDELVDGVRLQLYNAADSTMLRETVTVNGHYLFDRLAPGTYFLKIMDLPDSTQLVTPSVGAMDLNSDFLPESQTVTNRGFSSIIYLGAEMENMSVDAGIKKLGDTGNGPRTGPGEVTPYPGGKRAPRLPSGPLWGYIIHYLNNFAFLEFEDEEDPEVKFNIETEENKAEIMPRYKIFPNPVSYVFKLEIESPREKKLQGFLINSFGQNVKKIDKQNIRAGRTTIEIEVSQLEQGQYFLNFFIGDKQYIEKIIVVKR